MTVLEGGERGYDGGKKVTGRKRHVFVDILGLLLAVTVTAASVDDAAGCSTLVRARSFPKRFRGSRGWADSKYHNYGLQGLDGEGTTDVGFGSRFSSVRGCKGFVLLPSGGLPIAPSVGSIGVVDISKDYERRIDSSETMVEAQPHRADDPPACAGQPRRRFNYSLAA